MARQRVAVSDIKKAADRLSLSAKRLATAAETAEKAGLKEVTIHWSTIWGRYLPKTINWAIEVEKDVAIEAEEFLDGRPSAAAAAVSAYRTRRNAGKKRKAD